jgi:hypothetical protein
MLAPDPLGWKPVAQTPKQLLNRADEWVAHAHGVSGHFRFVFETPYGYGITPGEIAIESSTRFRVNYNRFKGTIRRPEISRGTIAANGAQYQMQDAFGTTSKADVTKSRLAKLPLDAWTTRYDSLLFTSLGTTDHPLVALMDAARAAGLSVKAGARSTIVNQNGRNRLISQDRIYMTGKGASNGKPATYSIEVILDHATGVPETIRFNRKSIEGQWRSFWTVRWDFTPRQTFPPNLFRLFTS